MKERPIIFSAPMVRAILDGRKTQTRRVINPQPTVSEQRLRELGAWADDLTLSEQVNAAFQAGCIDARCPYGRPGDRLWVRETWQHTPTLAADLQGPVMYRAHCEERPRPLAWRSPIHMPRWASRITLEVTGVRVERLQEISEADARAEGCAGGHGAIPEYGYSASPVEHYGFLWEQINGPGSWSANPWVWVIEFARVDAQQVAA